MIQKDDEIIVSTSIIFIILITQFNVILEIDLNVNRLLTVL